MGRLDQPTSPTGPGCKVSRMSASSVNGCVTPGRQDVVPTFTTPAEVFRTDYITAMKKPDGDMLTDAEYAVIEDSWKPEWERGVQVCVKPEVSMKPLKIKPGIGDHCPKKFSMPSANIAFKERDNSWASSERLQYDLDNVDSQWLARLQDMDIKGAKEVDEERLEACISFLESKCYENICQAIKDDDGLGVEYDADIMCAVCRELDSEDGNEMVFCDRCNICVHQACYGIHQIPAGKWYCNPCLCSLKPTCVLCGHEGGALKPVRLGTRWAHISCALWIPEVKIANVDTMEPISNFHSIPQSRWNLLCSICRIRQGACIQCCVPTCTVAFHVECAFQQGLKMKSRIDQAVTDAVRNEAYCPRHALLGTSPAGITSTAGTPQVNPRERRLKAMMDSFHQYARHTDLARKYRLAKPLATLIHSYWVLKRRLHNNQSFLSLPDPWQVVAEERLREFQEEKEKEESKDTSRPMVAEWELEWERFMILRQDMEKSRNLSYMLVRRERRKRQLLLLQKDIFFKSAQLALSSDDSQNLSLASAAVGSLRPPTPSSSSVTPEPRSPSAASAAAVRSPSAAAVRSLRSLSSPIASPGPYHGTLEVPSAKRLRSSSSSPEKSTPRNSASTGALERTPAPATPTAATPTPSSRLRLPISSARSTSTWSLGTPDVGKGRRSSADSPSSASSHYSPVFRRRSSRSSQLSSSSSPTPAAGSAAAAAAAATGSFFASTPIVPVSTKRRHSSRR